MKTITITEARRFVLDHPFIERVIIQGKKRSAKEALKILFNMPNQDLKVKFGVIGQKVTIEL